MVSERQATELATLINRVESYEDATYNARRDSERYRDYYDNKQLTPEERKTLQQRGQPTVIFNRVQRKIDFLTGLEKSKRVDPKAFPRTPQDQGAADAATDALRYVARNSDFDQIRSDVYENILIEGAGGAEVTIRPKKRKGKLATTSALQSAERDFEDHEIVVNWYPWDRLGWDPASRKADFSDARYKFAVIWKDLDEAEAKWPNPLDEGAVSSAVAHHDSDTETFEDRPHRSFWAYPDRRRIKIVLMWYKDVHEGWSWALFTRAGIIDRGVSPFVDENGERECPLELVSAYTDRDNDRYGVVRAMVSPQDEINKRRSKLLHMLTMRQVRADANAVQDVRHAKREMAKPDGWIETTPGANFEILQNGDQATGQFNLLDQTMQEMDLMGPNASMTGKGPQDQSGRAILAQQQGGNMEIATVEDRLRNWTLRIYRQMWRRVQQYWTEERWVRVTDNEQNLQFVGLNRPVTAGEMFSQELQQAAERGEMDEQAMQAELQAAQQDPRFNAQVGTENNVAELDVDIMLDEAPDTATIQHETFQQLFELKQADTQGKIPIEVLVEAMPNLRNKRELLDRMTGANDPQAQQAAQTQQRATELELMKLAAEAFKTRAEGEKTKAEVEKTGAETQETLTQASENQAGAAQKLRQADQEDARILLEAIEEAAQQRMQTQQSNRDTSAER